MKCVRLAILSVCLLFFSEMSFAVGGNDSACDNMTRDLGTRTEAIETLGETDFVFEQSLETLRIIGVKKATFYSCDGNLGYLVVYTSRRNYLYENVPRELWENFKIASSIDGFFNRNLKYNTIYLY